MSKEKTKIEFIPLMKDCTYHYSTKDKPCKNCNNTGKYNAGYYMIYERNGKKCGWFVDTIK